MAGHTNCRQTYGGLPLAPKGGASSLPRKEAWKPKAWPDTLRDCSSHPVGGRKHLLDAVPFWVLWLLALSQALPALNNKTRQNHTRPHPSPQTFITSFLFDTTEKEQNGL